MMDNIHDAAALEQIRSRLRIEPHHVRCLRNGFYKKQQTAEEALRRGNADLIGFGRPYISNPDLSARLRTGAQITVPERATFYTEGARGYVDYPPLV